jgi:uncharacterized protein YjiK
VVSDEGEISEIETDGTPLYRESLPGDLEGITVDPFSGYLYVLAEGEDQILEFDPVTKSVLRTFPICREYKGDPNFLQKQTRTFDNGCECIAFVPDDAHLEGGAFYVGNQWDPSCILELLVPLRSSSSGNEEAKIVRELPVRMDDPAAMYFDSETGRLNVVSDADNILFELTRDGRVVAEFAFPGDNQEGITKDDQGILYIAQDSGGILKVKDLR